LIHDPALADEAFQALIPGPDFPGGGQIISAPADIAEAYAVGRGSLRVRARWVIEELARGQWQLVVTELPPGTSAQKVLEEIEELTNPKLKAGKKSLSAEQTQLKAAVLAVLDAVRDESNKDAPVRLVFEPKSRAIEQADLIAVLLAQTSLETTAPLNLTMVGADGRPTQKGLRRILVEWIGIRTDTVRRRTQHRLGRVLDRVHVLEGRQLVLLNIDEVIRIIRNADEPRPALIARFDLSERQADDILDLRLRQLARLEAIAIEQELKKLRDDERRLAEILANPKVLERTLVREIEADARQFGDERRTLIRTEKKASAEVRIVDEPVTVVVSTRGWLRALKGNDVDPATLAFKPGDGLHRVFAARSVDTLLAFGPEGRVYSIAIAGLPGGRGDGQPVSSLIDLDAGKAPLHYFTGPADTVLLLAGSGGCGLLARAGDLLSRQRGGKAFYTVEDGETFLPPSVVQPGHTQVACLTGDARLLVFPLAELRLQPKGGRGLMLIETSSEAPLLSVAGFADQLDVYGSGRGGKPRNERLKYAGIAEHTGKRGRKGRKIEGFAKVERVSAPAVP
jgi:topoisomerase-4 subunit A